MKKPICHPSTVKRQWIFGRFRRFPPDPFAGRLDRGLAVKGRVASFAMPEDTSSAWTTVGRA
ncbi:MAG: hypothetical protein LBO66_01390 [Deltaproteobacteria bacterium]|nr:hypothetical protein [Deltaproteobacteria bacterium]